MLIGRTEIEMNRRGWCLRMGLYAVRGGAKRSKNKSGEMSEVVMVFLVGGG